MMADNPYPEWRRRACVHCAAGHSCGVSRMHWRTDKEGRVSTETVGRCTAPTAEEYIAALEAEVERLRDGASFAYQLAGLVDAPVEVLDNLSALANGKPTTHEWKAAESPLLCRIAALEAALRPFAEFVAAFDAQPINGLDREEIYSIHGGEHVKPYGATLKWSDLRRAREVLDGK